MGETLHERAFRKGQKSQQPKVEPGPEPKPAPKSDETKAPKMTRISLDADQDLHQQLRMAAAVRGGVDRVRRRRLADLACRRA